MAERGSRGLPNMPNTQNGAEHRVPDSEFRAGVAGVQRLGRADTQTGETSMIVCAFLIGLVVGVSASRLAARRLRKRCALMTQRWHRAVERHDHAKQVISRMVEEEGRRSSVVA